MDNQPQQDHKVEYVEAVPIEHEHPTVEPREQPQFRTYQTTSTSCSPCCGPIGCLAIGVLGFSLFMNSELFRALLMAVFVFLAVSAVFSFFTQRR